MAVTKRYGSNLFFFFCISFSQACIDHCDAGMTKVGNHTHTHFFLDGLNQMTQGQRVFKGLARITEMINKYKTR